MTDVLTSGSRGIRNNNPGNIRLTLTKWQGQVGPDEQTDKSFVQFISPEYGIRAMARTLRTYFSRGTNTVRGIISTWAPANENNTAAYIASVSGALKTSPDTVLTVTQLPQLIAAIIQHENGKQPYSAETIARGISMA